MKNIYILIVILVIILTLSACGPATGLQGAAGANETEPPAEEPPAKVQFYSTPDLLMKSSADGSYTTGLSISPMCKGQYQITAPKTLLIGEVGTIELIVASNTINIEKIELTDTTNTIQVLQSQAEVDLYPNMNAELKVDDTILVGTKSIDQLVQKDIPSTWYWYITPQKSGLHKLAITISVPADADGTISKFAVAPTEEFSISVLEPTPAPPTFTPPPSTPTPILLTSTPIPPTPDLSATGSKTTITVAIIGGISTIVAALIGVFAVIKQKDKVIYLQLERDRKAKESQRPTFFNEEDLKTLEEGKKRKERKEKEERNKSSTQNK
jgi:hypothetical protein